MGREFFRPIPLAELKPFMANGSSHSSGFDQRCPEYDSEWKEGDGHGLRTALANLLDKATDGYNKTTMTQDRNLLGTPSCRFVQPS